MNSAHFSLPAVSSRISRESIFPLLMRSASVEFERLRFARRGGDLVSGCFRWRARPLLGGGFFCVVLLLWEARGDSTLVIGDADQLNSEDAPESIG